MVRILYSTILLFSILFYYACNSHNKSGSHVIKIEINNLPDQTIYLEELGFNDEMIIDSVKSSNGKAIFSADLKEDYFYEIVIGGNKIPIIPDNDRIVIKAQWPQLENLSIEGSEGTSSIVNFERKLLEMNNCVVEQTREGLQTTIVSVNPEMVDDKKVNTFVRMSDMKRFIRDYADTVGYFQAAIYAVRNLDPVREVDYFQKFTTSLPKRFPSNKFTDSFVQILNENLRDIKRNMVKVGSHVPTLTGLNIELKPQEVKFDNKYTLIDFWASWCPPCRSENPNLRRTYQKWKGRNIQFVSYSLDENIKKWKAAISEDSLEWINLVDTTEWEAAVVTKFGFDRIPTNFLVDPTGKIIAVNLNGVELDEILVSLFQ